jgi:hypothetical protein
MQFTFFFLLLEGFTVPQFQQFVYYYCTEQIGFSETYWGFIVITCRIGVAIGILLYAKYYRKGEPRVIMFVSFIMQLFAELFLLLVITFTQATPNREWFYILSIQPPIGIAIAFAFLAPSSIIAKISPS